VSLAFSTLIFEWRRYFAAIIALAVAGLMVLAMTGMFLGVGKAFTATIDRSPAEIMVLAADSDSLFGNNSGLPRRLIPTVYQHPDVIEVMPLSGSWAFWSNFPKDGQPAKGNGVQVMVIDPAPGSLTIPNDFDERMLQTIAEP
jgi:putative ABC transport system permease protein